MRATGGAEGSVEEPGPPGGSLREEVRRVAGLAWPIVLGLLAHMAMGAVDTLMVGRLGGEALAAMALAHGYGFSWVILARGLVHGIDPLVTQAFGAGDEERVGRSLSLGLVVGCLAAIPVTLAHLVAGPVLAALGQPEEVVPLAARYCVALAPGVLPMLVFLACRQVLHGMGRVRPVMAATVGAAVLNVLLNRWWMFGGLGVPALGALGCALATSACQVALLLGLLALAWSPLRRAWRGLRPGWDLAGLRRVLGFGAPVALQLGLEVWGFNAATFLAGRLGADPVAAHSVVLSLATLTFTVPLGVSQAATTRVGNLVGAGRPWGRAALASLLLGVGFMACSGLVLALWPEDLLRLYTSDPAVLALGSGIVLVAAAFQVFDGAQVVGAGILRALGDVRRPAILVAVSFWGAGLPAGALLALGLGWGLAGIWCGLALGLCLLALGLSARIARLAARGAPVSPPRR